MLENSGTVKPPKLLIEMKIETAMSALILEENKDGAENKARSY